MGIFLPAFLIERTSMLGTLEEDVKKIEAMEDSAEFQIKLQALRKKMLEIKRWSTAKYLVPFFLILMPRLIGRDSMILCFILIGSGLLFYYLKYHKMPEFFSNKESLQNVYAKEVLEPLLQNFYPDLTVEKKGIALEDVVRFTPKSQKYLQDTFLFFHDDRGLLMGNLESYHTTGGKHSKTIYDFTGQLYCMKSPVKVQGEVRIVPTDRAFLLKNEVQYRYPGCGKGEMKLDTEDIQHNEHFDIYATDEFGARRFLTPEVLRVFSEKFAGQELSIYIKGDLLYIAIYSGHKMFRAPYTEADINNLSFTEEYKKLRSSLEYIEDICKAFEEK